MFYNTLNSSLHLESRLLAMQNSEPLTYCKDPPFSLRRAEHLAVGPAVSSAQSGVFGFGAM